VATQLFAEYGFEDTSIEQVLRAADVSRGALYHHFPGKEALFEAVLEAVGDDVGRRALQGTAGVTDPYTGLRIACLAWIQIAGEPVVRRIMLIDAPAVLGWHRWRAMEEQTTLGQIRAVLAAMAAAGHLPPWLVDMFAHVVLASMNEIALVIATSDDTQTATLAGSAAVDEFLKRLLKPRPVRKRPRVVRW
jgi:AcrR family transcriptional regulator